MAGRTRADRTAKAKTAKLLRMCMISIPQAEAVRSIPGQLPRTADGDAPLRANEILSPDAQRMFYLINSLTTFEKTESPCSFFSELIVSSCASVTLVCTSLNART